jgi:hypothetical protein
MAPLDRGGRPAVIGPTGIAMPPHGIRVGGLGGLPGGLDALLNGVDHVAFDAGIIALLFQRE